jgi:hypothetical protein
MRMTTWMWLGVIVLIVGGGLWWFGNEAGNATAVRGGRIVLIVGVVIFLIGVLLVVLGGIDTPPLLLDND